MYAYLNVALDECVFLQVCVMYACMKVFRHECSLYMHEYIYAFINTSERCGPVVITPASYPGGADSNLDPDTGHPD